MSTATANVAPTDGVRVKIWVDWDRQPVSVHSESREDLEALILHLRQQHNVRKRSLVMPDREQGGFLFFLYQTCDPRWIAAFLDGRRG